jgi:hypothetical protein
LFNDSGINHLSSGLYPSIYYFTVLPFTVQAKH